MNVIVFASRTGGSGKSTLAPHLAAQVHRRLHSILLIDSDPQGSLTLWHKMRGSGERPLCTATEAAANNKSRWTRRVWLVFKCVSAGIRREEACCTKAQVISAV